MSLYGRLERYWFEPGPARRLGMLRVIVGGWALSELYAEQSVYERLAYHADPRLFEPIGVLSWMKAPMPHDVFGILNLAALVLGWAFVFGVGHRVTGPLFAAASLAVITYRNSFGMIYHVHNTMMVHVMVLALAPSAAAFSVDALLSRALPAGIARWWSPASLRPEVHWTFGWPVRLMLFLAAVAYFIAGVAKMAGEAGLAWMVGTNLRDQIAGDALLKELLVGSSRESVYWLYQHGEYMMPFTVGTMLIELGGPFVLPFRRLAILWALGAIGMHWGIYFAMNIKFAYPLYGIAFLGLLPLEQILDFALGPRALGRLAALIPEAVRGPPARLLRALRVLPAG